ncbi:MAG: hypothetical protein CV080_12325 [Candidatus Kuenenia stuttgartiensis]|nr:MAG: hypothetical protein CV080_12325 [Candidatus Kuenenia stuttgartiensis]
MTTTIKQETGLIKVRQYIIDSEGHKVAAIIDIEELSRLGEVLKNIPSSEVWLYQNSEAFEGVQKGLKEASEGKISKLNLDDL